ncbi:MAG: hypothetical protein ACN6QT_22420 [Burkholderia contaminans]|uniref:Uncharacterized protein n=2 Tax=Pseudomonadota TaxID=1224 RepID=A0AAP4QXB6_9BURK|nr:MULTISPECIES: hypothetical protein [Burkholderia]MBD1409671.1 hypothetical protein [Burkholderia contaminans]MBH9671262.1 hypothetical protein [Burkholderia contaminans]MBH9678455.1 hypothetical protein [Burkholderia contaminans]MBH9708670.1 hypothetical protein [Burkholderia contaminans]MBM6425198.1 hypothetical protein [Burkholderia contaminans]
MWPFKKRVTASAANPASSSDKVLEPAAAPSDPVYCYVEFESNGEKALQRLTKFFDLVKAAKDSDEPADESQLSAYLIEAERAYFPSLTAEEVAEWNEYWFSTPLPKRHSPEMPTPGWDFASMLDAFWNGDYDLIAIRLRATRHVLEFNPHGYPYGGIGSLVAMVECFGHQVVGVDDGTGYEKYVPRTNIWKPRARRVV